MRVLLDTCVWGGAKIELSRPGHDVIWGGDWETDPGDAEILALARSKYRSLPASLADACLELIAELHESSTVLTLDSDFRIYRMHKRRVIPLLTPPDIT